MAHADNIQEVEVAKIRSVKAKASDLTNKLRKKVNLLIDVVNNSKLDTAQRKETLKAKGLDYDILKD